MRSVSARSMPVLVENRRSLAKWRKHNLYYYRDIERLYQFLVRSHSRVLDVGSGSGYLLNVVDAAEGLGIDVDPVAVAEARQTFPNLEFQVQNAEDFQVEAAFDYVLFANTLSYLGNIQKTLQNTRQACKPSTRVVLTFHNPGWEPILNFATAIGQRMSLPPLNWLSLEDVENLLDLAGFEVVSHGKRQLFPKNVPLVSWFFNRVLAPLPGFNSLCLTESVVARVRPDAKAIAGTQEKTCSVIVPARNEAGNIEDCVARMPRMGRHTEIIFIEGHSRDNTWEEIQRVQEEYGNQWDIKIAQQSGKGKGDAVRQGFNMATGDVMMILDSDLTVCPEDLIYFFEAVASGKCEFANGCRLIYPVSQETMPWLNRVANRLFAWFLSYLMNTTIKDSLCGTKAMSRENYKKLAANRAYFGDFDPFGDFDLLFGSAKLGLHITDIPVRYMPRTYGSSNIQHIKEGMVLLKMCMYAAQKLKFV